MSRRVRILPRADRDIDAQVEWLTAQAGFDVALRFFDAVHKACRSLLAMPGKGRPRKVRNPRLEGLRSWPVPGFRQHFIFYLSTEAGIYVIRVLHAARDVERILAREPKPD